VSLWRRPSGVYESHIMVDGVRYRKSTGTTNKRLAERIDNKYLEELLAKRFQVEEHEFNPGMKFSELATRFLAAGSKPWHRERLTVVLPYFAGMEIGHISKSVVDRYRTHRHSQKKITESTVNHDVQCLRHILYWAVDQGFIPENPLTRLKLEKPRRKKRPVMSLEDEEKLLQAAAGHLRRIIICALDTGMRRGEILSQRWEDVDFTRRLLYVTHSKTAGGESREIPLTKRLFELLSNEQKPEGLIFTLNGKPIHQLKTGWKAAIRRAKLRNYRFKDLRSSFNSRLIEAGVIKDVRKELMGHSRNEDTNDLYSHIELPILREAIEKLEQWVEKQKRKEEPKASGKTPPQNAQAQSLDGEPLLTNEEWQETRRLRIN
jgi:integrase